MLSHGRCGSGADVGMWELGVIRTSMGNVDGKGQPLKLKGVSTPERNQYEIVLRECIYK